MRQWFVIAGLALALFGACDSGTRKSSDSGRLQGSSVEGWLGWRGPAQNGTSMETGLPDSVQVDGPNHLWTYKLPGRGTPVIAGDRVYTFGYEGEGPDLREVLVCLDADSGRRLVLFEAAASCVRMPRTARRCQHFRLPLP